VGSTGLGGTGLGGSGLGLTFLTNLLGTSMEKSYSCANYYSLLRNFALGGLNFKMGVF